MTAPTGTIVVALGGNALAPPGEPAAIRDQFRHARESLSVVVELAKRGWCVAIVHGNGPQVGNDLLRNEIARDRVEPLPLGVLVAVTAGWIGYMLQQSLLNALAAAGVDREVLTVITQTVVSRPDLQGPVPTKPIGLALSANEADELRQRGIPVGRDREGRYRRLVVSPDPLDIVEAPAVRDLVAAGKIVIAAGGGGAPVFFDRPGHLDGMDAVIDKDRVAAILGRCLDAETLLILTDVDGIYEAWGTEHRRMLPCLSVAATNALLEAGELGEGSMRPKALAAVEFVNHGGERAIIAHLDRGWEAACGKAGTVITRRG